MIYAYHHSFSCTPSLYILLITSYEYEFRINKKKCKNYNNYEVRKYII